MLNRMSYETGLLEATHTARDEARIVDTNHVLVVLSPLNDEHLVKDFCGSIVTAQELARRRPDLAGKTVYLGGNLEEATSLVPALEAAERVLVIDELTSGTCQTWPSVPLGRVPMSVHGVGVLYRCFFDLNIDYIQRIHAEHTFQDLTQSTKPGRAHRTGIYLTPVEPIGQDLHFHLLRCSTNLSGPTENFKATDWHIVNALNQAASRIFEDQAPLNHVLAQLYNNTPATDTKKQSKAKINAHADKTKDMPRHGIMAFCTFYDGLHKLQVLPDDPFDYGYNTTSGLTQLFFRRKSSMTKGIPNTWPARFTVTLYPNSVFFMPLSTNRWYTHEIRPSKLDAEQLPTRLGYVVRCSTTKAVHTDDQTFLIGRDGLRKLEPPTPEGMTELRRLYAEENRTDDIIDYADRFAFSMNKGDYIAPHYNMADEFRQYVLPIEGGNPFEELSISARFQNVGRGRKGTVLVNPDKVHGVPIVRTTTPYDVPAQTFRVIHLQLAEQIRQAASLPHAFNNALIERYTNMYTTMGDHSDQAQDLLDDSYIALFSCYRYPERATTARRLVVKSKAFEGGRFEIPLVHNSVVVFSLATNRRFKHKIVLDKSANSPKNEWLGVTFRTSRTFVRFSDTQALLKDGTTLTLASNDERNALYQLRGRENRELDFVYPSMSYTLSPSDLIPPEPAT